MIDDNSGAAMRQFLIDNGALRPAAMAAADGLTRYRGTLGTVAVTLDHAGKRAAQENIERGRSGRLDHSAFVPEFAWRPE